MAWACLSIATAAVEPYSAVLYVRSFLECTDFSLMMVREVLYDSCRRPQERLPADYGRAKLSLTVWIYLPVAGRLVEPPCTLCPRGRHLLFGGALNVDVVHFPRFRFILCSYAPIVQVEKAMSIGQWPT